jgi:hypothetical protein
MFSQGREIGVPGQPFEIAITECQSAIKGVGGRSKFAIEAIAAREVVKNERIGGFEFRELFVDIEAALELAALGVVIAKDLEGFDVLLVAPNDSFHEGDFNVQFASFFTRQSSGLGTAFHRHTTYGIVYKWGKQVKFQIQWKAKNLGILRRH